jgi:hypothetical protein
VLKLAAAMDVPGADLVAAAQALVPEGHAAHRPAGRSSK